MIPRKYPRRFPPTGSPEATQSVAPQPAFAETELAADAHPEVTLGEEAPSPEPSAWAGSRWEYLVGYFARRGTELWFESSLHGRLTIRGRGARGYADLLNRLGDEGWELTHCDDTPPRTLVDAGAQSVYAWGDMIFKRLRAASPSQPLP